MFEVIECGVVVDDFDDVQCVWIVVFGVGYFFEFVDYLWCVFDWEVVGQLVVVVFGDMVYCWFVFVADQDWSVVGMDWFGIVVGLIE